MAKKIRVWDGSAWQDVSVALPYNAVHSAQASMPSTAVDGQIWLDTDGTLSDTQYIPKTLTSTTGDIIYASSANTPARLGIGTSGQLLGISGGVPAWTTPVANTTSYALINTGGTSLTGSSVTISGLGGYNKLFIIIDNFSCAGPTDIFIRVNADSGSNYRAAGFGYNGTETTTAAAFGSGYNGNLQDRLNLGTFYGTTQVGGASIMIDGANSSGLKPYQVSVGGYPSGSGYIYPVNQGVYSGSAITSLVFHALTQNWDSGTVRIYGA